MGFTGQLQQAAPPAWYGGQIAPAAPRTPWTGLLPWWFRARPDLSASPEASPLRTAAPAEASAPPALRGERGSGQLTAPGGLDQAAEVPMVPQQTAFDAAPAKPSRPDAKIWANWLADCWTTAAYWANGGGIGYLVGWLRRWLATDIRFFGWIPEGQRYDCLREFRDLYFAGGGTQPP